MANTATTKELIRLLNSMELEAESVYELCMIDHCPEISVAPMYLGQFHGKRGKKLKGDLDLSDRSGMLAGGETSVDVLVPGDAHGSTLYVAATWENPDLEMPPKENDRLSKVQLGYLRNWIDEGAPSASGEIPFVALGA